MSSTGNRLLIAIACMINFAIGYAYLRPFDDRRVVDLPQFYIAGKLAASGRISHLYDPAVYVGWNEELRKEAPKSANWPNYFNRPAFEAFLFVPLSYFSFRTASHLITWANLMLLAILVWRLPAWLPGMPHSRVWLFIFMPFLYSIALGQDTLLLTLIVGFGIHRLLKKQDASAGAIIALAGFKFHLIIGIPLALIAARRWRALAAFSAAGAALCLFSLMLVGVEGFRSWIVLLRAPTTDTALNLMGNVRALGIHFGMLAAISAAVLTVASFVFVLIQGSFEEKIASSLIAAALLGPHVYLHDYSLVAIAGLLALRPAAFYLLFLPWLYFYPSIDIVPLALAAMGCLLSIAFSKYTVGANLFRTARKANETSRIGRITLKGTPRNNRI
jgi:hypothetical protein